MNLMIWLHVEFHNYWFWKFYSFVGENFESGKLGKNMLVESIFEFPMIPLQKPNKLYFNLLFYYDNCQIISFSKIQNKYCFSYIKAYWMEIMWKTVKLIFLYVVEIIIMGTLTMFVICLIFMAFCVTVMEFVSNKLSKLLLHFYHDFTKYQAPPFIEC
jgi:hypothetical protein